tara:strand:- start:51 stop:359 length:309 start_codon:yes stop_codon:yes gene_type:complete
MDVLSHKKMEAQLVFLSEPPTSLMIKVSLDMLKFKIFQLVETLTRSSDSYKLSNTLTNSVRFAHLDGSQEAKLWFQILTRLKNILRDNENLEQLYNTQIKFY